MNGSVSSQGKTTSPLVPSWLLRESVRPYVLMRSENEIQSPGVLHNFNWFAHAPLQYNPQKLEHLDFYDQVLKIDELAFGGAGLGMPRWVFYDCAAMPGLICGFAVQKNHLTPALKAALKMTGAADSLEWVPVSLFIIIPCVEKGHWVAHNLCAINDLLPESERLRGLGFLSKAFGLWYANVEYLNGVTQWQRPAIKLHANYGSFELKTAYTPAHTYAESLTYRLKVNATYWHHFFDRQEIDGFEAAHIDSGLLVSPQDSVNLKQIQRRIENGEGPFFLSGKEILKKPMGAALSLYLQRK